VNKVHRLAYIFTDMYIGFSLLYLQKNAIETIAFVWRICWELV